MESFTFSKPFPFHGLATVITLFLLYLCTITITLCLAARPEQLMKSNTTDFIKTSCGVTRYPEICYETLLPYASTIQTSPKELANAALLVSLKEAQSTSASVLKLSKGQDLTSREAGAVKDCVENMSDSIDELQQSLMEMKDLQGPDFDLKISNVMTWVSAALTDEDTCMDNLQGNGFIAFNGKVKDTIRRYIVRVSQLTSNALALINQLRL